METPQFSAGVILEQRYLLLRKLGSGGYGAVWLAEDLAAFPGRQVAVKVLLPDVREKGGLRRFRREADILLSLSHPNVVRAFDLVITDELAFLVMEHLSGETLFRVLRERAREERPLSLGQVRAILAPICHAVEAAHAAGVLHRDLKPSNVMLTPGGVKVLDFGIAKLLGDAADEATTLGRRLGSYLYMAPEQVLGQPLSVRSDVFALGSILFELLTLHRAWGRDPSGEPLRGFEIAPEGINAPVAILMRIASGERPLPSRFRPGLPVGLDVVTARALALDPVHRPASAADFLEEMLDAIRGDWPLPERTPSFWEADESPPEQPTRADTRPELPSPSTVDPPVAEGARTLLFVGLVAALLFVLLSWR